MVPLGNIFGLRPFEPKRILILPCEGGEIMLYVLDGEGHIGPSIDAGSRERKTVKAVKFDGWWPTFQNSELDVPAEKIMKSGDGLERCVLEVAFRLVPLARGGQTAEIVAISYDGGRMFFNNELSTLSKEHAE